MVAGFRAGALPVAPRVLPPRGSLVGGVPARLRVGQGGGVGGQLRGLCLTEGTSGSGRFRGSAAKLSRK